MPNKRKVASKAVRDPVRKGHMGFVGITPSRKAGAGIGLGVVQWESRLERDCLRLLEFSTGVAEIQHQPEKIMLGGTSYAIPDFSVITDEGMKWIIDVKPAEKLADQKIHDRLKATAEVVNGRGDTYVLLTEREIRREPISSNLSLLMGYRRPYIDLDDLLAAQIDVFRLRARTYGELLEITGSESMALTLLAFQCLEWDYSSPLNKKTEISKALSINRLLFEQSQELSVNQ